MRVLWIGIEGEGIRRVMGAEVRITRPLTDPRRAPIVGLDSRVGRSLDSVIGGTIDAGIAQDVRRALAILEVVPGRSRTRSTRMPPSMAV